MDEVLEQVLFALVILFSVFSRHIATCFPDCWFPVSILSTGASTSQQSNAGRIVKVGKCSLCLN